MKKTLFSMAVLALCGTAFAGVYGTGMYSNGAVINSSALNDFFAPITLNVDSSVVFNKIQLAPVSSPTHPDLTLRFFANNTLQAENLYLGLYSGCPTAIYGDESAQTSWGTLLTSSENITTITLASGSGKTTFDNLTDVTLNGQSANTSVTLGSATMTYVGYFTDMDEAKAAIANGTKVALVGVSSEEGGALTLVGHLGSPTPEPTPDTNDEILKSATETRTNVAALVNSAADFMATTGVQQAKLAAKVAALAGKDGAAPFVAMGGSSMRYNTGSHVDADGFNGALGVAKAFDDITLGLAGEYGISSYKSYVGSTNGKGNSKLYGAALLADWQGKQGWHAEGAVRLGRTSTDYSAMTALGHKHYSDHASYQGALIGGGKEFKVSRKCDDTVDLYARYMYSHTNGSNTTASSGEAMHFSAVDSHRTMVGARYNHELTDTAVVYAGAAWMHEFNGDAHAVIGGFGAPSPSLEGDSGMVEIGTTFAPCESKNILLNLNVQGWTGVQRGISGGAGCTIKF